MPRHLGLFVSLIVGLAPAAAADWPQWRGPNRDGTAPDFTVPERWPDQLTKRWQVEVGEGHAGPVVAGGKVFQFARQGDEEVVRCLDLATGEEVWKQSYPAPYEMNSAATAHGKGPKSTPAVREGRLVTLGISGILSCWDTASGRLIWRKEFGKLYPATSPLYGTAASPLIDGGRVIAHVGGHDKGALTAFDLPTGQVQWTYAGDGPGYASPILVELAGERQLITQTQNFLVGVQANTGKLLWREPFQTQYDQNSVTPVLCKDLLIFSGYNRPVQAVRLAKQGGAVRARAVWSNNGHSFYMSTPVVKDGLLFGMGQERSGQIVCLDGATGKTRWQNDGRMGENVALVRAGTVVALLRNEGQLVFIKAGAAGYEPVARYQVADTPTWAHPVLLGKRILVKDRERLLAWDVE